MGRNISQLHVTNAILSGIDNAHRFYEECSGGNWLWTAPEYLMSVHIAKAINSLDGAKFVTLETNVHQTLKDAQAITLGAPKKRLRHKGRFDIVLWWGSGVPRAAIEVKNQVYSFAQIAKDVERIESVVERNKGKSSFQFGAVTFYTSCVDRTKKAAQEILGERLQSLYQKAVSHVSSGMSVTLRRGEIETEAESAWVSSCLVFKTTAPAAVP